MTAQQLKNSILQLAVQGKLVQQDPNDKPASVLLERICAEKERLVKEGKIKKEKPLPPISEDEIPFDVPESWEWVRLRSLGIFSGGKTPSMSNYRFWNGGNIPWVSSKDMKTKHISSSEMMITQAAADTMKLYNVGTLIMVVRSGILKRTLPLSFLSVPSTINQDIKALEFYDNSISEYIYFAIKAFEPYILFELVKAVTTVDSLKFDEFQDLLIPLPPKLEQERIIEKLFIAENIIERYNTAEQKLTALNAKFPDQLKKSILQAAVQGKLVPQDENDEPASVLLERIQAEKERLIKDGKLKKEKPLPPITEDDIPFDVPESWEWVQLGDIGDTNIGLTYSPSNIAKTGTAVLRSNNIKDGRINYDELVHVNVDVPARAFANIGDILICARNGSRRLVGKTAIIEKDGMAFGAFMAIFRSQLNPYIKIFLDSSAFRGQFDGVETTTINQVTQDMLKNTLIPVPPLAEQHRIVTRGAELLSLIERGI